MTPVREKITIYFLTEPPKADLRLGVYLRHDRRGARCRNRGFTVSFQDQRASFLSEQVFRRHGEGKSERRPWGKRKRRSK